MSKQFAVVIFLSILNCELFALVLVRLSKKKARAEQLCFEYLLLNNEAGLLVFSNLKVGLIFLLWILIIAVIVPLINADVYVGTCEGYVRNTETQLVSDTTVIATVNRCVSSCSQQTQTNANGYYVVANLNLPKLETLTVYAEKMTALGLEFGYAAGTANEFQAARVDVIICLPPIIPTLVHQPNTHETSVNLQ